MLLSFRCPPHLKERIDALIRAGLYPDVNAFVVTAVENQLLAEAQQPAADDERPARPDAEYARPSYRLMPASASVPPPAPSDAVALAGLERSRLPAEPPLPLHKPDVFLQAEELACPVEKWVFGQYNRLLPAKVSLRALALLVAAERAPLPLDEAAPLLAEIAARFGSFLRSLDKLHGTHRDDALATAFPEEGREGAKGRLRYQNHFVGQLVGGAPAGLLAVFHLAELSVRKHRTYIVPTAPGWHFAGLDNPLLDGPSAAERERFSADERQFLLDHIRAHVPQELYACHVVLVKIRQGHDTPDALNKQLGRLLGPDRKAAKEQDFLTTQRTGVLARAADLGLVARKRQARAISYEVTEAGLQWLKTLPALPHPIHQQDKS